MYAIRSYYVLIILFPEPAAFLPFLFLTGFQFYMLQAKPGRNLKSVLTHLLLLGTSLIFAFAIPLERDEAGGNPIVDKLSGVLQKSMAVLVPDLPLILNVPGYVITSYSIHYTKLYEAEDSRGTAIRLTKVGAGEQDLKIMPCSTASATLRTMNSSFAPSSPTPGCAPSRAASSASYNFV